MMSRRMAPIPAAIVILGAGGTILLRAAPGLAGASPGEAIGVWATAWIWAVAVLPPALIGGLAFPVLAEHLAANGMIAAAVNHHGNTAAEEQPAPQGAQLGLEQAVPVARLIRLERIGADQLGNITGPVRLGLPARPHLDEPDLRGPVNAVAPDPPTQASFARALRPASISGWMSTAITLPPTSLKICCCSWLNWPRASSTARCCSRSFCWMRRCSASSV